MATEPQIRQHYHQVAVRTGTIKRVRPGCTPVVELRLWENERLVSLELREKVGRRGRKTVDWGWTAVIDVDCGALPVGQEGVSDVHGG